MDWLGREEQAPSRWGRFIDWLPGWAQGILIAVACLFVIPMLSWFVVYLIIYGLNG